MNPFIRNSIQMAQLLILLSVLPPSYQARSHLSPVMWLLPYVQLHCEPPSHLLHISSALACFQDTDLGPPVCVFSFFLFQNSLPFNLQMSVCAAPFLRSLSYCFKNGSEICFYHVSDGKEPGCNSGPSSTPGSGRSPEEGHGNPVQYSCLESPTDGGASSLLFMGLPRVGHGWASFPFTSVCFNQGW